MIPNIAKHFTPEEKALYKAIQHDLEQAHSDIGSLELKRDKLLKSVFDRVGSHILGNGQDNPNV
jgi:hypothetical protein